MCLVPSRELQVLSIGMDRAIQIAQKETMWTKFKATIECVLMRVNFPDQEARAEALHFA